MDDAIRFTAKERDFVYGVALRYMKDEERAHDVTQDALLLAYRHRHSFRGDARFTTWLYRIAATTALMHLRQSRRRPVVDSLDDDERTEEGPRDEVATPEERWAFTEALALAGAHLAELGDKYDRIFAMRFVEGYSETEIARQLRLNVSTVKTRAYRARAHLRRQLRAATAA